MKPVLTLAIVALVVTAFLLLVWAAQRHLVYFPDADVPAPAAAGLASVRELTIPVEDGGTIGGWFVPLPGARYTVIVFNGNAGHRAYRAALAGALRGRGFAVLLFDYRGFGGNAGTPSERGLAADARAARAELLRTQGVAPDRLVYFGESLGAAVAVSLAAEHPPAALVLRSPFTSLADIGRFHYPVLPVALLLRDRFDSLTAIQRVRVPTLVIAGERDAIVPLEQSRRLFDGSAAGRKEWVAISGADHNDAALTDGPLVIEAVAAFLQQ